MSIRSRNDLRAFEDKKNNLLPVESGSNRDCPKSFAKAFEGDVRLFAVKLFLNGICKSDVSKNRTFSVMAERYSAT